MRFSRVSESYCNSARREKIRSALKGRLWKRMPVASARALPMAGLTGMSGSLADRLRAERTITVVGVGEEDLGSGDVGEGRNAVIPEGGIHDGAESRRSPFARTGSIPIPWATAALELAPRLHRD